MQINKIKIKNKGNINRKIRSKIIKNIQITIKFNQMLITKNRNKIIKSIRKRKIKMVMLLLIMKMEKKVNILRIITMGKQRKKRIGKTNSMMMKMMIVQLIMKKNQK